jgi:hypothetical protein
VYQLHGYASIKRQGSQGIEEGAHLLLGANIAVHVRLDVVYPEQIRLYCLAHIAGIVEERSAADICLGHNAHSLLQIGP